MKRRFFFIILGTVFCSFLLVPCVHSGNPFTTQHADKKPIVSFSKPVILSKVFVKIIDLQKYLKVHMARLVRQAETGGSIKPIILLILAAVLYGIIHAAGPGHGKAIALSYVLTQKPSYRQGLIFSNTVALFHGISGIIFVFFIRFITHSSIMGNLDQYTNITQIISYSIISFIGAVLFLYSFYKIVKKNRTTSSINSKLNSVVPAAVIGCIPCPGVIVVMLFALSMDLMVLSLVLGIAISIGMAFTVSIVIALAISGKFALHIANEKRKKQAVNFEALFELFAGLLLMILGLLFLGATI